MPLLRMNYQELYKIQDKVFKTLQGYLGPLYLTGGTALSRFYLKHRYSDDLDFFVNNEESFVPLALKVRNRLAETFNISPDKSLQSETFLRVWIDIVVISREYSFSWPEVFEKALKKAIISEPDVVMRLRTFPSEMIQTQRWLSGAFNLEKFRANLNTVCNDFLLARKNSLGKFKKHISEAIPPYI